MAKLKFKPSFLMELTNEEFHGATRDILKLISEKGIEDVHVLTILENANKLMPELVNAVNSSRFHENTAIIHKLTNERRELLKSLSKSIEANELAETDELRIAARILFLWIRKEKKNFRSTKIALQSAMIQRLQAEINKNEKILEALQTSSLLARFEKIVELSNLIDQKVVQRTDEVNEASVRTFPIKVELYEIISLLLITIAGLANLKNSTDRLFYQTIGKSIQSTLTAANAALSYRKTVNAKKKNDDVDDDIEMNDEVTTEKTTDSSMEANPQNSDSPSSSDSEDPQE